MISQGDSTPAVSNIESIKRATSPNSGSPSFYYESAPATRPHSPDLYDRQYSLPRPPSDQAQFLDFQADIKTEQKDSPSSANTKNPASLTNTPRAGATNPGPYVVEGVNLLNRNSLDSNAVWERMKKRRENHNTVERRRRDNINSLIYECSELIPLSVQGSDFKHNKGNILKVTVQYVKQLQSKLLAALEENSKLKGTDTDPNEVEFCTASKISINSRAPSRLPTRPSSPKLCGSGILPGNFDDYSLDIPKPAQEFRPLMMGGSVQQRHEPYPIPNYNNTNRSRNNFDYTTHFRSLPVSPHFGSRKDDYSPPNGVGVGGGLPNLSAFQLPPPTTSHPQGETHSTLPPINPSSRINSPNQSQHPSPSLPPIRDLIGKNQS
jgi:hypothetical protein